MIGALQMHALGFSIGDLTAGGTAAALGLLVCGMALLCWPLIMRRIKTHRTQGHAPPPTLEARLEVIRATGRERDELERLVADAREAIRIGCGQLDERIGRLERLLEQADRIGEHPRSGCEVEPRGSSDRAHAWVGAISPSRAPAVEALSETQADPLTHEVYTLHDAGRNALEIATQLHEHLGKIELMLALRPRR